MEHGVPHGIEADRMVWSNGGVHHVHSMGFPYHDHSIADGGAVSLPTYLASSLVGVLVLWKW